MPSPRHFRLGPVSPLEDRSLPSGFSTPWPDANSLTLSFVPDGTQTPIGASTLATSLSDLGPAAVWKREILRAFQTWALHANIDIGLTADSGHPIGNIGAVQGDPRFGDIRIAATALDAGTVAAASPFTWIGTTFSGDMVVNNTRPFAIGIQEGAYDLFSVALHEAGHALGLDHSEDAQSVMNVNYRYATGMTSGDIAELQELYGPRYGDPSDSHPTGNDTMQTATPLSRYGLLGTRFRSAGDVTTVNDADWYSFTTLPTLGLTDVAVQLRASGLSLLTSRVTVYNAFGRAVETGESIDPLQNDLSIRFRNGFLGGTYYIKVESARSDVFGVGGYQLFADTLKVTAALPLVSTIADPLLDGLTNETLDTAFALQPRERATPDLRADYTHRGAIESPSDTDIFRVRAPQNDGTMLNVLSWGLDSRPLDPRIRVYDQSKSPVAFQVLSTDDGVMSVQVFDAVPDSDYFIQLSARLPVPEGSSGSYFLAVDFNGVEPIEFDSLSRNTLAPESTVTNSLRISTDGVFELALAAENLSASGGGSVTLTVLNNAQQVVASLSAEAGELPVTAIQYLATGTYSMRYSFQPVPGVAVGDLRYHLFLLKLNDGVGPYATTAGSDSSASGGTDGGSGGGGYTYSGSTSTQTSSYGYYF
jgi:hypothetical protein